MKELLVEIAKEIANYPDQVSVREKSDGQTILMELAVAQKDIGLIIGKKGQTIDAIRTIMRGISGKIRKRIVIELVEYSSSSISKPERPETTQLTASA